MQPDQLRKKNKSQEFVFGVKHQAFNAELRKRREARGLTQKELAEILGFGESTICLIETFRCFPSEYRQKVLSDFFGVGKEMLFPKWIASFKLARSSYTTEHIITERLLPQVIETLSLSTGMEDVEEAVDRDFLKREVKKVLSKLSDREAKVLKLRFGLEGNRQMNLEETGKVFGVTRERIRQIEAHALRKMRHIKNRGKLKAYL